MRYLILAVVIFASSGCATRWYEDEWVVTDIKLPGVSAIGFEQVHEWYGATALYSGSLVTFREARCEQPKFTVRGLAQGEFQHEFRTTFAALDIEDATVQVVEVGCPGRWTEPGSTFIEASSDVGYVVWDGAFFRLVRKSAANRYSYHCESGAQIDVHYPDTKRLLLTYQDTRYELENVISASGARYLGEGLEWWSRGTGPGASGTLARVTAGADTQIVERCEQR